MKQRIQQTNKPCIRLDISSFATTTISAHMHNSMLDFLSYFYKLQSKWSEDHEFESYGWIYNFVVLVNVTFILYLSLAHTTHTFGNRKRYCVYQIVIDAYVYCVFVCLSLSKIFVYVEFAFRWFCLFWNVSYVLW